MWRGGVAVTVQSSRDYSSLQSSRSQLGRPRGAASPSFEKTDGTDLVRSSRSSPLRVVLRPSNRTGSSAAFQRAARMTRPHLHRPRFTPDEPPSDTADPAGAAASARGRAGSIQRNKTMHQWVDPIYAHKRREGLPVGNDLCDHWADCEGRVIGSPKRPVCCDALPHGASGDAWQLVLDREFSVRKRGDPPATAPGHGTCSRDGR